MQLVQLLVVPPLVGLLNLPPRPLPPGAMFATSELKDCGADLLVLLLVFEEDFANTDVSSRSSQSRSEGRMPCRKCPKWGVVITLTLTDRGAYF